MMILLEKRSGLAVNPDDISSMSIHKSNGYSVLEVKMISGDKYRVRDTSHCFDGDDVHTLHKQLLEAM